ncbi:hydrogenase expression/formation protein HypE [archaeon]|nr:MAG: hydrogenase expression/formation protein HypE [archaeon]RLG65979.1 MAG: hydrogenase expression/formation protein HypE [archaeon]
MPEFVDITYGGGGAKTREIIENLIAKKAKKLNFWNGIGLESMDDGSAVPVNDGYLVFTSDSYTIKPIFFPGGDIGKLAISGTINDLAVMGAKPLAVMDNIIVEEGFSLKDLEKILDSIETLANENDVALIGGDFKVVERNGVDRIIIGMMGIGFAEKIVLDSGLSPGDKIIVSGPIGTHEIALLAYREGFSTENAIESDAKPLWNMISKALKVGGITAMKDPTRGGIAGALNEMAKKSRVNVVIYEEKLPFLDEVKGLAELLGIDLLEAANEGIVVMGVKEEKAYEVLEVLRRTSEGKSAEIIGEVVEGTGMVILETTIGGKRIVEEPIGSPTPRVC